MFSRSDFSPQVSIVTGGGSGIGLAIAAELVARGSSVVVADIDPVKAQGAATRLGPSASPATLDVADADAVTALVDRVVEERGRLDVMVNNAGVAIGGLLEELDERHWAKALDVNLRGVIHGVTAAYPHLRRQGHGSILNTASLAGLIPAVLLSSAPLAAPRAVVMSAASTSASTPSSRSTFSAFILSSTLVPMPMPQTATIFMWGSLRWVVCTRG